MSNGNPTECSYGGNTNNKCQFEGPKQKYVLIYYFSTQTHCGGDLQQMGESIIMIIIIMMIITLKMILVSIGSTARDIMLRIIKKERR